MTRRPSDNPFASRRIDGLRYRFRNGDFQSIAERLSRSAGRGAIIGPHGSGKTTLLEHLAGRLDGRPVWIRLNTDSVRPLESAADCLPHRIGSEHTVLIDGAEQLGPWSWWRLRRRTREAGIIIATSHGPGRLPIIHECTTNPELLAELVAELSPEMTEATDLDDLYLRHGGNIRLCFRELYDVWARRERS